MALSYKLHKWIKLSTCLLFVLIAIQAKAAGGYYYTIKIYHYKTTAQETILDAYLKDAYLPAAHKMGIAAVGVFKPIDIDTADRRTYVFIPFKNWKEIEIFNVAATDAAFATNNEYYKAVYNTPPYNRIETIILTAFSTRPKPALPKLIAAKASRIYELRSYESPTEAYHLNKVLMFNSGETDLFDRLNFNPIFYGSVVSGSHMPNLMYLTTFNSKAEREKHWDAFGKDAQWKQLSTDPSFQHNVSHADITFLYPVAYSEY